MEIMNEECKVYLLFLIAETFHFAALMIFFFSALYYVCVPYSGLYLTAQLVTKIGCTSHTTPAVMLEEPLGCSHPTACAVTRRLKAV